MFVISVTKIHALRNELPVSFPWSHIHGNISRFNIWRLFKYHSKRLKVFTSDSNNTLPAKKRIDDDDDDDK